MKKFTCLYNTKNNKVIKAFTSDNIKEITPAKHRNQNLSINYIFYDSCYRFDFIDLIKFKKIKEVN